MYGAGLECQVGLCVHTCAAPGVQSTCTNGQLCAGLSSGANICVVQVPRFDECNFDYSDAPLLCAPNQACQTGFVLDDGGVPFGATACQLPCGAGTGNTCGAGEACLPNTEGFVILQGTPDAGVACTAGNDAPCDTANGNRCVTLGSSLVRCARDVTACGTPVGPSDLRPTPDGGSRLTAAMLCNIGSTFFDADGGVAPVVSEQGDKSAPPDPVGHAQGVEQGVADV